jgi:hypothetical protein
MPGEPLRRKVLLMLSVVSGSSRMMVGGFLVGLALLLSLSLGNPASAASMYDYVDIDRIQEFITADVPLTGTFDITIDDGDCYLWDCDTGGFDPDTMDINNATIAFLLLDTQLGQWDIAVIDLGDSQEATVDVYLETIDANLHVFWQMSTNGTLHWELAAPEGNNGLFLDAGSLLANASAGSTVAHAPEPTAALLFCLGFGVIGTVTRKHRMH